jgi:hypothetical protein
VHARPKALLIGYPPQKRSQQIALILGQRRQERFLMVARHFTHRLKKVFALLCHMQDIRAPVVRVFASFDEPAVLQLIDEGDKTARKHTQTLSDLLLAEAGRGRNDPHRAHVSGSQSKWSKTLREF